MAFAAAFTVSKHHDDGLLDGVDPCNDPSCEKDEAIFANGDMEEMAQEVLVAEGHEMAPDDNTDDGPHYVTEPVLGSHPVITRSAVSHRNTQLAQNDLRAA